MSLETLADRAFVDPIGRVAWSREDALAAAALLAASSKAILGAEMWCLCEHGTYSCVIPLQNDDYKRRAWNLEELWNRERETWEAFCARSLASVEPFFASTYFDDELRPDYGPDKMRIHLRAVSRSDYEGE